MYVFFKYSTAKSARIDCHVNTLKCIPLGDFAIAIVKYSTATLLE